MINDFIIARDITSDAEIASRLSSTPMYDMTDDNIKALEEKVKETNTLITALRIANPTEIYLARLDKLL